MKVEKLDYLLASKRGGHWRLADGYVQRWTTNGFERQWAAYPWTNNVVSFCACEDAQGNLVVGALGQGIFWFDAQGRWTRLSTKEGLSDNAVVSLHMDVEGNLWVGTAGGGLNRVRRQVFEVMEQSEGSAVQSVCEDGQAGLWFSSTRAGADHWKDGEAEHFGVEQDLKSFFVRVMFVDHAGEVWAGTWSGGLFRKQEDQFMAAPGFAEVANPGVCAIYQDRTGRLWVGTQGGLARWEERQWRFFTTRDKLSGNIVRALADDAAGNLWIGTYGGLDCLRDAGSENRRTPPGAHLRPVC
jgi:ligand-binding sensor domain-containing protein